jgi:SAM-dependent methyltransferase
MRHAPATLRNREPILAVLARVLPKEGLVLEIASGTGEHAAFMAPRLTGIEWQPTDRDAAALKDIDDAASFEKNARIRPAIALDVTAPEWPVAHADAIFCCNMIHIAPWNAAEGLFAGAARILPAGARLILYGPFKRHGAHTAPSNETFEKWLRDQDRRYGVRCLDTQVMPLAERNGFSLDEIVPMPANNLTVVWRKL